MHLPHRRLIPVDDLAIDDGVHYRMHGGIAGEVAGAS
jgi:hypothetical protein